MAVAGMLHDAAMWRSIQKPDGAATPTDRLNRRLLPAEWFLDGQLIGDGRHAGNASGNPGDLVDLRGIHDCAVERHGAALRHDADIAGVDLLVLADGGVDCPAQRTIGL